METMLIISSVLLWVIVLFNLLLTLGLIRRQNSSAHHTQPPPELLKAGQLAPEFTAQTLDEKIVTLTTYAGQQIALIFISTGCAPCRDLLPELERLYPHMRNANIELALVISDSLEETRAFAQQRHIDLPILVAPRKINPFFDTYKATQTPSYYLLDAEGIIQSAGLPSLRGSEWEQLTAVWMKQDAQTLSERR